MSNNKTIYIKGIYTVFGKDYSSSNTNLEFIVPIEEHVIKVVLNPKDNVIQSECKLSISKELHYELSQDKHYSNEDDMSSALRDELESLGKMLSKSSRKILEILKYSFKCVGISENLCSRKRGLWSEDRRKWKEVPFSIECYVDTYGYLKLDQECVKVVQEYVDKGHHPFSALRFLHKAMVEVNPKYKWIDATIAAELAIKEFYSKYNSDLKPLLLEIPSPPLSKLYGSILEKYTGQRSPKLRSIRKGVETRNKLVHDPEAADINIDDANTYAHDVEDAIYHLLYLLDPEDFAANRWGSRV